ncbi:hypothetical protein K440DRAFT_635860 [Wilcoxina mikolae CBS 423.85]|nr:hypothetical protein K440DRAFT_635860 [Wilcoxina mikolae CBS 423.85]
MARLSAFGRTLTTFFTFSVMIATLASSLPSLPPRNPGRQFALWRRDFDGIGFSVSDICVNTTNKHIQDASELNKVGAAAATTIMTLLPALLTFALIPTANIRDLIYTSPWLAFWTAWMTFGLPVVQLDSVSSSKIITASDFLGEHRGNTSNEGPGSDSSVSGTTIPSAGSRTQSTSSDGTALLSTDPSDVHASADWLRSGIFLDRRRRIAIWKQCILIGFVGLVIACHFYVLVGLLPRIVTLNIIWVCPNSPTTVLANWLSVAGFLSSLSNLFWNSTFRRPQMVFHLTWNPNFPMVEMQSLDGETYPHEYSQPTLGRSLLDAMDLSMYFWAIRRYLNRGQKQDGPTTAQFRKSPSPLMVVVRIADDIVHSSVNPLIRVVFGTSQAIMLVLLTFIFGSMYPLRLLHASLFVVAFTCTVSFSRGLSIWASGQLQKGTGLTILECKTMKEMDSVYKRLLSLKNVVVENQTDGILYFGGHQKIFPAIVYRYQYLLFYEEPCARIFSTNDRERIYNSLSEHPTAPPPPSPTEEGITASHNATLADLQARITALEKERKKNGDRNGDGWILLIIVGGIILFIGTVVVTAVYLEERGEERKAAWFREFGGDGLRLLTGR